MARIRRLLDDLQRRTRLLVRLGGTFTPRSRVEYRLHRLLMGRTRFADAGALAWAAVVPARLVSLPFVYAFHLATWPLVRRLHRGAPWSVVEVRFEGTVAAFVKQADASSAEDAARLRAELLAAPPT